MGELLKKWGKWFVQSATLVGIPTMLYLTAYSAKAGYQVAACKLADVQCEESKDAVESAMQTLLDAYPGYDVQLKKLK